MDVNPLVQAGGVAGMFGICVSLIIALFRAISRQQRTLVDQQQALIVQNRELERDHQWCRRRLNLVLNVLDANGIKVPAYVWLDSPPSEEADHA